MWISKFLGMVSAVVIASGLFVLQTHSAPDLRDPIAGIHLAGLVDIDPDTGSTSIPCGADGKCNPGVCRSDPDCPFDDEDPQPALSTAGITDCTGGQANEIAEAIEFGTNNWAKFETTLESFYGWPVNIKNCLETRFKDNGKVVCEQSSNGQCNGANGWASMFNKKCHLCPAFLNTVGRLSSADRKACYFALVTHEWAHTCERSHKTVEIFDDVAFDFWKAKHPEVTIALSSCGMN